MNVHVNLWAVLLSAVASMVIGGIWYAKPELGDSWMKLAKLDRKKRQQGMAAPLILAFVLSLLMAYVLAHLAYITHQFFQDSFMRDSLQTALWLWLGVAFTRVVTHDAFEHRPFKLTIMNVGNMLVTMLAMGAIIGRLHP